MKNYFKEKIIFINLILIYMVPVVYANDCRQIIADKIVLSKDHIAELNTNEALITSLLQRFPKASEFINRDHFEIVQSVISLMPRVLPNINLEKIPEVIFVNSLEELYKLRFENVSYHFAQSTGADRSDQTLQFVKKDFAFYDPYANRIVVNIRTFSTFLLHIFPGDKEPKLEQYTDALKIFLAHELTHGFQENNFKLVSKMISSGSKQPQLSVLLQGHALYIQELFAKLINAEGFLSNMHQQAYDLPGAKNTTLKETLDLKMLFESHHESGRDAFWKKYLSDFKRIYSQALFDEIEIKNLTEIGRLEREIVSSIWSEGREDEFARPLKIFDPELTPDGKKAEQYHQIISEVKKIKEGHLDTKIRFIYKAEEVIGFFRIVEVDGTVGTVELDQIYILEKMRGKGIGSFVMNHMIEEFGNKTIELYVLKDNPAVEFYKRFGFKITESLNITKGYVHVPQLPVYKMERIR